MAGFYNPTLAEAIFHRNALLSHGTVIALGVLIRMMIPILAMILGGVGLLACLLAVLRLRLQSTRPEVVEPVPPTRLNKDLDLDRYKATESPILHLEKDLPDHPFKVGDGGVFCGVCLINTNLKRQTVPVLIHTHACTVIRKEWKLAICRIGAQVEYFVSLDKAHLRKKGY